MSWPKKLETEEDISQLINAYQAKKIFRDLRKGNTQNLFKFFQDGIWKKGDKIGVDLNWFYKKVHGETLFDEDGTLKTRWQNGEANMPEDWDIEKLRRCK